MRVRWNVGGTPGPTTTVTPTQWGTATVALPFPLLPGNASAGQVQVEVLALDDEQATVVATLPILLPATADARDVLVESTEDGGVRVLARDRDGAVLPGQPLTVSGRPLAPLQTITGDDGALHLPATVIGTATTWSAHLPHGTTRHTVRVAPAPLTVSTRIDDTGQVLARIEGPPGPVSVWLTAAARSLRAPSPLATPLTGLPAEFVGPRAWTADDELHPAEAAAARVDGPVAPTALVIDDSGVLEVALTPDGTGPQVLRVVATDGRTGSTRQTLDRLDLPPIDLPLAPLPGSPVAVDARELALVTVESAHGLDAEWSNNPRLRLPTAPRVGIRWTDLTGQHGSTTRTLDPELDVDLTVEPAGDRWKVRVEVRDAAGAPVSAEVAVRALDRRLVDNVAAMGIADLDFSTWDGQGHARSGASGFGGPIYNAAHSTRIEGGLLAEAARQRESERSRRAGSGALEGGKSEILMGQLVLEEQAIGGLGTSGSGSGGGGYGRGSGRMGKRSSGSVLRRSRHLGTGHEVAGVWEVRPTSKDGVLELEVDAPPPGDWLVRAHAIGAESDGHTHTAVSTDLAPRLVLPEDRSGIPGEHRTLQVKVVNPTAQVWTGKVDQEAISVPPGGASSIELDTVEPGISTTIRLTDASGRIVDEALTTFDLAPPAVPDAAGTMVRVSVGPGDTLPIQRWLDEDRAVVEPHAGISARTGRIALALAAASTGDNANQAQDIALEQLALVRMAPGSPTFRDGVSVVAFLAEVAPLTRAKSAAERRVPAVSSNELDDAIAAMERVARSSADRVAVQWARVVAGKDPDHTTLARLLRDADRLEPEDRSLLGDVQRRLGDLASARSLLSGDGPNARVLAGALGATLVSRAPGLPPPGHPDCAQAILALLSTTSGRPAPGTATVLVDGTPRATLDTNTGDAQTLLVEATSRVEVVGSAGAVVERGTPAAVDGIARSAPVPGIAGIGRVADHPEQPKTATCGESTNPCVVRPGDALEVPGFSWTPGAHCGAGLDCEDQRVVARQTGVFAVHGYRSAAANGSSEPRTLWVEVTTSPATPEDWTRAMSLAVALARDAEGLDPIPWLARWPHFDDWKDHERPAAMELFWKHRDRESAEQVVRRFENLRDAHPGAALSLEEVGTVAVAYRAVDNPGRALQVWRAAMGVAFLSEIAPLRRLEAELGSLASLQSLVEVPQRYPDLEVVQEAEFHLPEQLASIADSPLPPELLSQGVTATDIHLLAAAWDRRFLAFHPDSSFADEAGFHLAKGLLDLDAFEAAARQARYTAERFPDSALLDALVATEATAHTALGDTRQARPLYDHLAVGTDWPAEDGTRGPALLRDDARLALARLDEAAGRIDAAVATYRSIASNTDAQHTAVALQRVSLAIQPSGFRLIACRQNA